VAEGTGKTVATLNGLKALTEASSIGRRVKPVYFKVSDADIGDIYPGIDLHDLPSVWYQADITGYIPVNDSTVQFILDIPQDKATKYGKTFGLYLEDGTLFAVAKPPYPFPPSMRQRFKVQFVWEQIDSVMNFEDIPFYEFDQDVVHLDAISTITLALFDVQKHLAVLEQFKADYYRFKDSTSQKLLNHESRISANDQRLLDHEIAFLELSSTYGNQILENIQNHLILIDQFKADYYGFKHDAGKEIDSLKEQIKKRVLLSRSFSGSATLPRTGSNDTIPSNPLFTFEFEKHYEDSLLLLQMNFISSTGNGYLRFAKVDVEGVVTIEDVQGFRFIGTGAYGIDLLGKAATFLTKIPKGSYLLNVYMWEGERSLDTGNTNAAQGQVKIHIHEIL